MPRIGITGHVVLAAGTPELVLAGLVRELTRYAGPELHGVTCLAAGADQLFARAVRTLGGTYEVIIPAADYRGSVVDAGNRAAFDELLAGATEVRYMPFDTSGREAYLAASVALLHRCDLLFAVWDGAATAAVGDTADVVRVARSYGIPVTVLWPSGARRG